jgi:hypothetical protein
MRTAGLLMLLVACRPTSTTPKSPTATEEARSSAAERVVRQQYDAYNRHDLDAFVAAYSPTVRFYRYPDSLVIDGRDAVQDRFGKIFANAPQLHANVDARMTHGDFVVWKETATGMPEGKTNTAIFVYEVHGDQITRVLVVP